MAALCQAAGWTSLPVRAASHLAGVRLAASPAFIAGHFDVLTSAVAEVERPTMPMLGKPHPGFWTEGCG